MSFVTRCPACATHFRVVSDQLKISDGWVRCGQCGEVFDASMRCVAPEARIIPMGFASGVIPQIPANILLVKNATVIGFYYGYYNGWGGKAAPTPKEAVALAKRRALVMDAQAELMRWHYRLGHLPFVQY